MASRGIAIGVLLAQVLITAPVQAAGTQAGEPATSTPIKHLIVLMQENHSFDNYFGTYPGANGIPQGVKMPVDPNDPTAGVVEPFKIGNYPITDLSHSADTFAQQYDQGKMDGFVSALNDRKQNGKLAMGYYTDQELPFHWNVADNYVLFDNLFSSARDGSFANHVYWVMGTDPPQQNVRLSAHAYDNLPTIFDRLQEKGISWKFYVQNYDPSITYRNLTASGNRASQVIWVPLLNIDRFLDNPDLNSHIVDLNEYYSDLKNGTLPAVSYIVPSGASEHPPSNLITGQRFVKELIQELMRSNFWSNSAFMYMYDDWGGWYDHVNPPQVDEFGYGLRVPGLLVSTYARKGVVDHTQLDFTSILKFIEENWGVQPLAQRDAQANNFLSAFDFKQHPRPAVFISLQRPTGAAAKQVPVNIIYLFYGIALFSAIVFISNAILRSVIRRRSRDKANPSKGVSPS